MTKRRPSSLLRNRTVIGAAVLTLFINLTGIVAFVPSYISAAHSNRLASPVADIRGQFPRVRSSEGLAKSAVQPTIRRTKSLGAWGGAAIESVSAAATSAAGAVVPPPVSFTSLALASLVPTLLGFYRSEYGVSYGYGTAVAAFAFLVFRSLLNSSPSSLCSLASVHALAILFYGVRLNLFLLYREIFLPRFRIMRERIEDRAKSRGGRFARAPFLLSCAGLYWCMSAPILVTALLCRDIAMIPSPPYVAPSTLRGWIAILLRSSIVLTWGGFLLGAVGDVTKSIVKARKGEDELVTGGVYRFFRHPNYTGEIFAWTASCVSAFLAVAAFGEGGMRWLAYAPYLGASLLGNLGIVSVLAMATGALEDRQKDKYGATPKYQNWVKKSWMGFRMGQKEQSESDHDEEDEEVDE